jgi:hypothetical protein
MTNQGKLLTKLKPRYVRVLRVYLGWSIETYGSNLSNVLIFFIALLCAKISSVYKPLQYFIHKSFRLCQGV